MVQEEPAPSTVTVAVLFPPSCTTAVGAVEMTVPPAETVSVPVALLPIRKKSPVLRVLPAPTVRLPPRGAPASTVNVERSERVPEVQLKREGLPLVSMEAAESVPPARLRTVPKVSQIFSTPVVETAPVPEMESVPAPPARLGEPPR